jgi:hypothetical protein
MKANNSGFDSIYTAVHVSRQEGRWPLILHAQAHCRTAAAAGKAESVTASEVTSNFALVLVML